MRLRAGDGERVSLGTLSIVVDETRGGLSLPPGEVSGAELGATCIPFSSGMKIGAS